jgi:hypothetical protein
VQSRGGQPGRRPLTEASAGVALFGAPRRNASAFIGQQVVDGQAPQIALYGNVTVVIDSRCRPDRAGDRSRADAQGHNWRKQSSTVTSNSDAGRESQPSLLV